MPWPPSLSQAKAEDWPTSTHVSMRAGRQHDGNHVSSGEGLSPLCSTALLTQQLGELGGRHRSADEVALDLVAALALEKIHLGLGFDALGYHFELQAVHHGDDRPDDRGVFLGLFEF